MGNVSMVGLEINSGYCTLIGDILLVIKARALYNMNIVRYNNKSESNVIQNRVCCENYLYKVYNKLYKA